MDCSEVIYVFQTDSDIVKNYRTKNANYVIEIDSNSPHKDLCVIYFTSNAVYYPNTKAQFVDSIVEKDYYEWRQSAPISAYKQIFIRDIYKQWYLQGVNNQINTPPKILELLKRETAGYRVIAVGSSAGGYAAILYGSLLNAEKVFAFNPQWEVKSLLESSDEKKNPIIFRESCNPDIRRYYDIVPFLNETPIYYFISENSPWDAQQRDHIGIRCGVNIISFKSAHHGIPFPRVALSSLLTMSDEKLHDFVGKKYYPIIFSIKIIGLWKTITNTASQLISMLRKKYEKC